jgi:hypothetical protein
MDYTKAILTDHMRERLQRRSLDMDAIYRVLAQPESIQVVRSGRVVVQSGWRGLWLCTGHGS